MSNTQTLRPLAKRGPVPLSDQVSSGKDPTPSGGQRGKKKKQTASTVETPELISANPEIDTDNSEMNTGPTDPTAKNSKSAQEGALKQGSTAVGKQPEVVWESTMGENSFHKEQFLYVQLIVAFLLLLIVLSHLLTVLTLYLDPISALLPSPIPKDIESEEEDPISALLPSPIPKDIESEEEDPSDIPPAIFIPTDASCRHDRLVLELQIQEAEFQLRVLQGEFNDPIIKASIWDY
ncbi:hypothetical protein BV22DRAFT_1200094 [Leucogyrophana mollusca]|uniref:Uncharacterized protein n=1 Tax=Leucogyrophana mollusca TaxID=85980 RepID=A0ACB8AZ05_9AGAM|nr:hypothetical protein BV22DRAFT_1200094 [Leucogyrophana mollusca]